MSHDFPLFHTGHAEDFQFATSDVHSGHFNILEWCKRPWDTVEAMEDGIVERWNAVVQPDDRVLVLGDAAMGTRNRKKQMDVITSRLQMFKRLNGHLYLVPGNHDMCNPLLHTDYKEWEDLYLENGFSQVLFPSLMLYVHEPDGSDWHILVNHFPYLGSNPEDPRYECIQPNADVTGHMPLLHGHVHRKWRMKDNMLNAGMDVWGCAPLSMDAVIDLLRPLRVRKEGSDGQLG